ncbi:hypothetical protein GE21DRAFT_868 [Neurospora crassa]|uniref:DUF1746 domain-containing protein n=1 Tax=Neurospora crassa (strain ATCC 24698 / 74-OR23-1A / CBS 708.71 / DSM 1257 / FGSC 987) TaxID=367110 RepID=Q7SH53_NEUCR|nr:hypothetical protein NCU02676 [Neurospora crassa OR74A]EAA36213.2 hypothetical protein NCU02676 [Neurospora crassa OR74A]KHE90123.1 hypothetical protein GE21DRAFT_868 [Neurospora crassa]|eukprot:XP_965449.2 hypothetical protein NCU02676 [Neurospora crassa OR74A]
MNDDSEPSFAARQQEQEQQQQQQQQQQQHIPPHNANEDGSRRNDNHERSTELNGSAHDDNDDDDDQTSREEKRKLGLKKKLQFMSHLQRNLDMIYFAYLCTLYYMECSFLRLFVRIIPHFMFITPKEGPVLLPAERPHVFAILGPNLICILAHIISAPPVAGEATRGYLHGGVIVDFVGQKPPTTRLGPLFFDAVILAIQCLMLAIHTEREKLRKVVNPSLQPLWAGPGQVGQQTGASGSDGVRQPETSQTLDAEERGVNREDEMALGDGEGTETDRLVAESRGGQGQDDEQRLGSNYSPASAGIDLFDVMRSGNASVGSFHPVHAIRTVGNDYQTAAAYTVQSIGFHAAAVAGNRGVRGIAGITNRAARRGI